MKPTFTKIITAIIGIVMLVTFSAQSETIISTQDGNWNVGATWVDGIVPTSADSVVVNHLVDIINGDSCMALYVGSSGTIQNKVNSTRTLVVLSNLWVDGTVSYTNNYFNIRLGGNLHLNGIWSNPRVYFIGISEQVVSATPGKIFETTQSSILFENVDPASPLKFTTDLTFKNIELIGNGSTIEFSPGIDVAFYGEPIRDADIVGNNSSLLFREGAFIEDSNLDNLTLKGVFTVGDDNTASGEIIVADTLQNLVNLTRTLVIMGNLWIDGSVVYTNNYFNIKLSGNLHLNGIWSSPRVYFIGTSEQVVSATPGKIFEATRSSILFENVDPASPLKFTTNLTFKNIELIGNGSTIEFSPGIEVAFYGEPIRNANIIGNNSALLMRDGAFIEDSNLDNLTLKGVFTVGDDNTASGELIIADTLQNLINSTRMLEVFGNFTNHGFITETNNHLNMIFHGNINNSGIWESSNIYLDGIVDQYISSEPGSYFLCERIEDREISSKIILVGDLDIRDAVIDLNASTMEASGQNIALRMGAYLMDATIDQAILGGEFKCFHDCVFTGETIISDTLCNYTVSVYITLTFHGKLINNGVIRRSNSYALNLGLLADFENNGPVDIETITLGGIVDQTFSSTSKGSVIDVDQVNDTVAGSALILASDLTFIGSAIDMGGAEIHQNNGDLTMLGGNIKNGIVYSNGNFINQSDEAYFTNMHLNNTHLKGVCQVFSTANQFTNVTLDDTLQNRSTALYPQISVHGDFINNGVINNSNSYRINMQLDGNFYNHGITFMNQLTFTGTGIQEFSSVDGVMLDTDITSTKPSGYILAVDDLVFEDCIIDMDSTTINLQDADIIMYGGKLEETVVEGNYNTLLMHRAKAQNVTLKDVSMEGTTLMYGYQNIMENVTISDTLSKPSSPSQQTFISTIGTFRNNGCITKEGSYDIFFKVEDEVINNGEWYSEQLSFEGNDLHFIGSENGSIFEIDHIVHAGNGGAVEIISELYLLNTSMDLDNYSLVLQENGTINLNNSSMNEVNLMCGANAIIHGENNSWLGYSTIDGASFTGEIEVKQDNTLSDCILNGDILNPDINNMIYLDFENEFLNNGNIYNNPATNYDLYVNFLGNLNQNGTIQNQEARWMGTTDQDVYLLNGSEINTQCEFYAMTGTGSYQWYQNGTELTGETNDILDFPELLPANRGFYYCTTNEGTSRTIRVCTPVEIDLAAEAWFCQNESVMLEPEITFGEPPYTWSWSPAEGLSDPNMQNPWANPGTPTLYTLTVTDAIGCKGEINIFVQQHPQLFADAGNDKEICFGQTTVLNGSASGGVPEYTYHWMPATGLSNPDIATPLATPEVTTTYMLTTTDANGCTETDEVSVTVNPLPEAFGLSQDSTHFCYEQDTIICWLLDSEIGVEYELFVNASPNPGGEVFAGTGEAIPIWASTTVQGHYTLMGINATTGCEKMMLGSVMIFIDFLPEVVDQSGDETVIEGESNTLWVEVTSTQPPWLQWYKDGEIIPGAQDHNLVLENVDLNATGSYQCLVSNNCDVAWSDPVSITVLQRQSVEIPAGWSGFSTYQDVWDADVENMFSQIEENMIIVSDFNHVYWPGGNLNTYGEWDEKIGAQIKMMESVTLDIDGLPAENTDLLLDAGWHYLPVLSTCPVSAQELFGPLGEDLALVKDIAGTGLYWPEYEIYSLEMLYPGKAYLIKMNNEANIQFPTCFKQSSIAPSTEKPDNTSPWPSPANTPASHLVVIPQREAAACLQAGDYVGAFSTSGICSGLCRYEKGNLVLTVFADDPTTAEQDGMMEQEPIRLLVYRTENQQTRSLSLEYNPKYDGEDFKSQGISVAGSLKILASEAGEVRVYPNPAADFIMLSGAEPGTSWILLSSNGTFVGMGTLDDGSRIHVGKYGPGLYTLQLKNSSGLSMHKVLVK